MVFKMAAATALLTGFFVLELTTALMIGSIALRADAGHILTDVAATFMGADRAPAPSRLGWPGAR
jgi:cobalt-zinc-cadmium efflux system protein